MESHDHIFYVILKLQITREEVAVVNTNNFASLRLNIIIASFTGTCRQPGEIMPRTRFLAAGALQTNTSRVLNQQQRRNILIWMVYPPARI